jgi:hypothetical protein
MAKHGSWTVIFEDKMVIKKTGEFGITNGRGYNIDDDAFWSQSKFDNIHAIQFTDDNVDNDQVEYKDDSQNGSYDSNVLGNFNEFITRWDTAHLAALQSEWDEDNVEGETEAEKITRLGARPTSYSS